MASLILPVSQIQIFFKHIFSNTLKVLSFTKARGSCLTPTRSNGNNYMYLFTVVFNPSGTRKDGKIF